MKAGYNSRLWAFACCTLALAAVSFLTMTPTGVTGQENVAIIAAMPVDNHLSSMGSDPIEISGCKTR